MLLPSTIAFNMTSTPSIKFTISSSRETPASITSLPPELLSAILLYLTPLDISHLCRVNRPFRRYFTPPLYRLGVSLCHSDSHLTPIEATIIYNNLPALRRLVRYGVPVDDGLLEFAIKIYGGPLPGRGDGRRRGKRGKGRMRRDGKKVIKFLLNQIPARLPDAKSPVHTASTVSSFRDKESEYEVTRHPGSPEKKMLDASYNRVRSFNALLWVCGEGRREDPGLVRLLLSRGGDIGARDKAGNGVLHLAAMRGWGRVLRVVLEWDRRMKLGKRGRLDVNMENDEGMTPLLLGMERGCKESVKVLREFGAVEDGGMARLLLFLLVGSWCFVGTGLRRFI
ncbi:Similar to Ankyrin-2; acc. no. Q01484 [Pyronema omphalodes CBS 100304]|uniref:Similar to Ankyrin-2 acc. no. Q01484 n=1 Tax=Pyronema omphalodes (strain CBS 100304) TaxID=1076935 RepID=U4LAN1_PYROM|nr:Similar to Ankyrin-2; acc. no. Q01484 [Pyronema omphalodes CBS 100304]